MCGAFGTGIACSHLILHKRLLTEGFPHSQGQFGFSRNGDLNFALHNHEEGISVIVLFKDYVLVLVLQTDHVVRN